MEEICFTQPDKAGPLSPRPFDKARRRLEPFVFSAGCCEESDLADARFAKFYAFLVAPARRLLQVLRLKLFLKSRSIKIALVGDNLISLKSNDGSSFE